MAEFLEDPSVLTKDKLKYELAANNVALPSGEHKKEVYVQLYLKYLTVQNSKKSPPVDTFSSDEELPAPVVSNKSRSGRKATRKTDKPRIEVEVTELTDDDLKEHLAKYGVDAGPIVASSRKLYEKKLQKLLEDSAVEAEAAADVTILPKADTNQNGNTNSDQYSDKEDEEITSTEAEAVPIVEKPVRSRGKTPVTLRTSSRRQTKVVEEVAVSEGTPVKSSESVVEDILANEINTPTGISATCRRPIRGAAGRPLKPSDYWLDESRVRHSVYTESRSYSESISRGGAGVALSPSPTGKAPARRGVLSLTLRLCVLLAVICGLLYLAYHHLDAAHLSALGGLLEGVLVPLRDTAQRAATYLGLGDK
ncbi:lamina-associated polypeptide 2, isoforms beta/gamma-like [Corythoichthys intestinalis]|uniref:lamina-associated polypeptide 2, isoforms beta/gamma-like n=1 Tax=Corythoichthys intestinalis TaxID=161448 RepID=UPI0025A54FE7|nr:lamina-associated polypeptide 2, isoforms beta/gamma-like [Corythoichthys intestinalis]XP_061812960.1 lamina-associated polypeptide 2, isoforms beta/gamma-like [Nerophis lumbriciformis]